MRVIGFENYVKLPVEMPRLDKSAIKQIFKHLLGRKFNENIFIKFLLEFCDGFVYFGSLVNSVVVRVLKIFCYVNLVNVCKVCNAKD